MSFSSDPLLYLPRRATFSQRTEIDVCSKSVLLYGVFEQRSEPDQDWLVLFGDREYLRSASWKGFAHRKDPQVSRQLAIVTQPIYVIGTCQSHLDALTIYLDITGLPHHVWMPLVKACIEAGVVTNCIYVEPKSYSYNPIPKPGEFFDLSERIQGFFSDSDLRPHNTQAT